MAWPFFIRDKKIDDYKKHDHIKDYTDDELYTELENAEEMPAVILGVICAEILIRQRKK